VNFSEFIQLKLCKNHISMKLHFLRWEKCMKKKPDSDILAQDAEKLSSLRPDCTEGSSKNPDSECIFSQKLATKFLRDLLTAFFHLFWHLKFNPNITLSLHKTLKLHWLLYTTFSRLSTMAFKFLFSSSDFLNNTANTVIFPELSVVVCRFVFSSMWTKWSWKNRVFRIVF